MRARETLRRRTSPVLPIPATTFAAPERDAAAPDPRIPIAPEHSALRGNVLSRMSAHAPERSGGWMSDGVVQRALPKDLQTGIESLSGMDMSDVRVHRDSAKPAEYSALAYAQGNDIHVAPGQEHHLPHEAWHVVQQRQGRVQPTMQRKGVAISNDAALERESDTMGRKALTMGGHARPLTRPMNRAGAHSPVIQRAHTDTGLKKEGAVERFSNKVKARVTGKKNPLGSIKQWETLDPDAKIAKVAKYVNAELTKTHVPEVGSVPDGGKTFSNAEFDFQNWALSIGSIGLDAPMDDDEVGEMADTVYHESRHAEQWFRIARLKAGEAPTPTAAELAGSLFIPANIAAAALDRPLKPLTSLQKAFHSKKYAERHQEKMDEAASWYQSIYGTGAAHRNEVLGDINNRNAEYRALSEEVDAWGVGGSAGTKIRALLQEERDRAARKLAAANVNAPEGEGA